MALSISCLVILLFLSAFFSSSETAFTSLSLVQIQELKARYKRRGALVEELYQQPERLLTTILIGNNLANISASVISSALIIQLLGNAALGITTAVLTLLILIFGEILPKQLAIRHNAALCIHTARIIKNLSILFLPIIWFINGFSALFTRQGKKSGRDSFTKDSILYMVKHAEKTGKIENYKTQMVQSVFRFSDIAVHAIMTHRQKVFSLNQSLSVKDAIPAVVQHGFSRIPLYKDNPENITGVVLDRDLLHLSAEGKLETVLETIANPPVFIPETWKVYRVFRKLKEEFLNLAVVLDEYGGLAGIVTMEDLVEAIIGELYDEDEEPDEVKIQRSLHEEGGYNVQGDAPIHLLEEILGDTIHHDRNAETAGGYILQQLSALPVKGQTIKTDIGTFVIESMSGKRVQHLKYYPEKNEDS